MSVVGDWWLVACQWSVVLQYAEISDLYSLNLISRKCLVLPKKSLKINHLWSPNFQINQQASVKTIKLKCLKHGTLC